VGNCGGLVAQSDLAALRTATPAGKGTKKREGRWTKRLRRAWVRHVLLRNKENLARDHLANERTFLAWVRTSLAGMILGLAVANFKLTRFSFILGVLFLSISGLFLLYASLRYFRVMKRLKAGFFETNNAGVIFVTLLGLAVTATAIVLLIIEEED